MTSAFKLALYGVIILSIIGGVFFLGYRAGSNKEKVIIQEKIIHAGERHAEIEQRQSNHVATRGQRFHINLLRKRSF